MHEHSHVDPYVNSIYLYTYKTLIEKIRLIGEGCVRVCLHLLQNLKTHI